MVAIESIDKFKSNIKLETKKKDIEKKILKLKVPQKNILKR